MTVRDVTVVASKRPIGPSCGRSPDTGDFPDMGSDEAFTVLLVERRREVAATLAAAERDFARIVEAGTSVATDDEHDPEGAGLAIERARIVGVLEGARAELTALDEAQARLDRGEYGVCARCSGPIAHARLEARPTTTTCITCASGRPRRR